MNCLLFIAALTFGTHCVADVPKACAQYPAELSTLVENQQTALRAIPTYDSLQAGMEALQQVNRRNTMRLKSLVNACGWPRQSVEGRQAVNNAFAVTRLATDDLLFQRAVLTHLESAVLANEASPLQLAYLTDLIAVAEGRPQSYGTQLVEVGICKFDFAPLDSRSGVDARRRQLKLQPLEEFISMVNNPGVSSGCPAPIAP
jgi:hypothetical protein